MTTTMPSSFRISVLLAICIATQVASMDMMVTCTVDEATRDKSHCDLPLSEACVEQMWASAKEADAEVFGEDIFMASESNIDSISTSNVWDEISEVMRECAELGMRRYANPSGWEMHSNRNKEQENRRNLRPPKQQEKREQEQQERELRRCQGTCYSPRSSCCLLSPSFCASTCGSGCDCSRRRQLGADDPDSPDWVNSDRNDEIELAIGDDDDNAGLPADDENRSSDPLVMERKNVIARCENQMEALRIRLLHQHGAPPNFCLGDSADVAITCNAYSSHYVL
jgi:hypothetical protein